MSGYSNFKSYLNASPEEKGAADGTTLSSLVEGAVTYASLGMYGSALTSSTYNFLTFRANGGYGYQLGNFEFMYRNPRTKGGTVVSYESSFGNKFRIDYHNFHEMPKNISHYHTNFGGRSLSTHRSLNTFSFGKPIK